MTAEPVVIALHVPKCAGSTVEAHLKRHLGAGFWSAPKRTRKAPLELFGRKHAMPPPVEPSQIRAVSGHFIGRSLEAMFQGRPIHRSVLLREPAALILSWYNYRMARYRAAGQATYPFGLHLRALPPDPVAHFLLERWLEKPWLRLAAMGRRDKRAALDTVLAGFDRVDDIAGADALVAEISMLLAIPQTAARENTKEEWEARSDWRPMALADLEAHDRAALDRRTRLDRYLWQRWARGEDVDLDHTVVMPFLVAEIARPRAEIARRLARSRAT